MTRPTELEESCLCNPLVGATPLEVQHPWRKGHYPLGEADGAIDAVFRRERLLRELGVEERREDVHPRSLLSRHLRRDEPAPVERKNKLGHSKLIGEIS